MKTRSLLPLLLLALVAALLAGCGSESSSRSSTGAYEAVKSAADDFSNQGAKFALALQDCTNMAKGDAADAACAKQALNTLAEQWAPIGAATAALEKVSSGTCQQQIQKAVDDASLLDGKDPQVPTTTQEAEALTTQVANAIQQFSQEIEAAASSCA